MAIDHSARIERRKRPRFKIDDGAVVFSMGNQTGIGKIVDISMDGLGFEYNSFRNNSRNTPTMLNIFVNKENFYLSEITGTVVSDVCLNGRQPSDVPAGAPRKKRCSVVFGHMHHALSRRLIHFLDMQTPDQPVDTEMVFNDPQINAQRCRSIAEKLTEGYFEVDKDGHFLFFNKAMRKLTGYSANVLAGLNVAELMDKDSQRKVFRILKKSRKRKMPPPVFEWELRKNDGTVLTVETSTSLIKDAGNHITGFRGLVREIQTDLFDECELLQMVTRDYVTGLLNKEAFLDHLEEMLRYAKRYETAFSMIFLELEDVHAITDLYGPSAGEYLLGRIGRIIHSKIRETDVACRYQNNEFVILLSDPARTAPDVVVEKLMRHLSGPHRVEGETIDQIAGRVGISTFPESGTDATSLIINAKSALRPYSPLRLQ
ncbi:MAG: sensor domain-containing diguanylate cyclase [Thermodesulfobacteriota bacterium]|nr:sensor domain-containing diguanylate cyclase [Thermodesulfobacteriota bacterium]